MNCTVIHLNYFEKTGKLSEFTSSIRRPERADLRAAAFVQGKQHAEQVKIPQ